MYRSSIERFQEAYRKFDYLQENAIITLTETTCILSTKYSYIGESIEFDIFVDKLGGVFINALYEGEEAEYIDGNVPQEVLEIFIFLYNHNVITNE